MEGNNRLYGIKNFAVKNNLYSRQKESLHPFAWLHVHTYTPNTRMHRLNTHHVQALPTPPTPHARTHTRQCFLMNTK